MWYRVLRNGNYLKTDNVFLCPSDPWASYSDTGLSYGINVNLFGQDQIADSTGQQTPVNIYRLGKRLSLQNTVAFTETVSDNSNPRFQTPGALRNNSFEVGCAGLTVIPTDPWPTGSYQYLYPVGAKHKGRANVLFIDGHVEPVRGDQLKDTATYWSPFQYYGWRKFKPGTQWKSDFSNTPKIANFSDF